MGTNYERGEWLVGDMRAKEDGRKQAWLECGG